MSSNDICSTFHMPEAEGSRNYFHENCADNWDFLSYFSTTHGNINKFKSFGKVKNDFLADLDWVLNSDIPIEVKKTCLRLKEDIPSKATVKAKKARKISKSPVNNQGILIYGDVQGNSFHININENASGSSVEGSKKRQLNEDDNEAGKGDDEEEKQTKKKGKKKEEVDSVWRDWIAFLRNEDNIKKFHPYSPEFHNIIRVGRSVSWRPNLDQDIYLRHLEEKKDEKFALPDITVDYLNLVIDSATLKEYKKTIKDVPDEDAAIFDCLEDIFRAYYDIYSSNQDLDDTEATFNDMLLYPFLKAVARAVAKETSSGAGFKVGETQLVAMKKQFEDHDEANLYKADGVIKLHKLKQIEILLLETSHHFGSEDRVKSSFDHHKGLFGVLAMLKTVADEYYLGSVKVFSKLKLFFVHASGKTVYLWSMRFVEEGPAYELWLEGAYDLKTSFDEKVEQLPKALNFYWMMKCLLQQAEETIRELEYEHKEALKKYRFSSFPSKNLSSFISPSILKLNEKEDKSGMGKLGPFYQK